MRGGEWRRSAETPLRGGAGLPVGTGEGGLVAQAGELVEELLLLFGRDLAVLDGLLDLGFEELDQGDDGVNEGDGFHGRQGVRRFG